MSLAQAVKNEAYRLGFSLVGVTTPEPPPHWPTFEHWLSLGRNGSMDYLIDRRRADPHRVLPECQSILVLAVRYPKPETAKHANNEFPAGRIASYALGQDYHLFLPARLKLLTSFIEKETGSSVKNRCYTDTGPVLERDLAQRAGLGWIGKNTCLINPKSGSYFLLAEILLGIELEPDAPFTADRCGKCTRCMDACPTGCILPDWMIDARLCISYLTIENKKEIPLVLRPQLGKWVFGCDICQQVCPWNRFASLEYDPSFIPRPDLMHPDLIPELSLSPAEFNQKFKGSPVLRSKRRGYLRNVAVALGNSGDQATEQALLMATQSKEPMVQEHATWALMKIQKGKSR